MNYCIGKVCGLGQEVDYHVIFYAVDLDNYLLSTFH